LQTAKDVREVVHEVAGMDVNSGFLFQADTGSAAHGVDTVTSDLAIQVQQNTEEIRLLRNLVNLLYEERATRAPRPVAANEESDEIRAVRAYLDGPVSLVETARFRDALAHYDAVVRASIANGGPSEEVFAKLHEDAVASSDHEPPTQ